MCSNQLSYSGIVKNRYLSIAVQRYYIFLYLQTFLQKKSIFYRKISFFDPKRHFLHPFMAIRWAKQMLPLAYGAHLDLNLTIALGSYGKLLAEQISWYSQ
jgi:hypothetical protein